MVQQSDEPQTSRRAVDDSDDVPVNPLHSPTFADVLARRLGRREFLRGTLAVSAAAGAFAITPVTLLGGCAAKPFTAGGHFDFPELDAGVDATHHVAAGYDADVLIRWGDPVLPDAPAFEPMNQSADAQERQFGYNNDYIGFAPLPIGSHSSEHALLCVNHEYTCQELMFPNYAGDTAQTVEIEMAAHGASIVEVRRGDGGKWQYVPNSRFNRRISTRSTIMAVSGPAAGHDRLKTTADPSGRRVIGTLSNCAGGMTPWGTYLLAEENFQHYFGGELAADHREQSNHRRYGVPDGKYGWHRYHQRFDVGREPNEPNRFGWIVEVDPYDPAATPVKRTALGRFKHEGAAVALNADNRVVVYMGDDQRFEYVYKFVSQGRFDAYDRKANRNLLDTGTLFAAKFSEDGMFEWLPLVFGTRALTPANGFASQADVVIEARRAADLLGATPMDRPEDVEANPKTGRVYIMLSNNSKRKPGDTNAANPRGPNPHGHIVELTPEG
ncbi:MAG: PhoX family phosphatase, partial [Gammaproteobacteria bacterium]|nr:PhoX family phosphatase [Gammaproteobacteria bacterium]